MVIAYIKKRASFWNHESIIPRYIEEQLNKRKNSRLQNGAGDNDCEPYNDEKYLSPEEAALLSLPEHLRVSSTHRSEEMLSNQMLNGIPEVDLGIDVKIKNIEATEAAKEKLIRDQKNKKVIAIKGKLRFMFEYPKCV